MKQGKRPTRRQKQLLEKSKLRPADWLVVKDRPECMELIRRDNKAGCTIMKDDPDVIFVTKGVMEFLSAKEGDHGSGHDP